MDQMPTFSLGKHDYGHLDVLSWEVVVKASLVLI